MPYCTRFAARSLIALLVLIGLTASASAQSLDARLSQVVDRVNAAGGALAFQAARVSIPTLASVLSSRTAAGATLTVRDNFTLDPYEGGLRGARGTLFSGGGSSLDRSILLGAILDELGVNWRIVRGTLQEAELSTLLAQTTGSGVWGGPAVPVGTRTYDPASDVRLRGALARHYWVQTEARSGWTDYDPTHPNAEFGTPIVAVEQAFEPRAVPADVRTVTIRLYHSSGSTTRTSFEWAGSLADVGYRNLTLTFRRSEVGDATLPTLAVIGDTLNGLSIPTSADRVWIEFYVDRGGAEQRITRDLYHRDSVVDFFNVDQQVVSIVLAPGFVGPDYYRAVLASQLEAVAAAAAQARPSLSRLDSDANAVSTLQLGEALEPVFASLAGVASLTYAHLSDTVSLRLGATLGVRPYYDRTRIIMTSIHRRGSELGIRIDARADEIAAVPYAGNPRLAAFAFQALRGRLNGALESIVLSSLTNREALALPSLFETARAAGLGLRTIHLGNVARLSETSYSSEAQMRLNDTVTSSGYAAIALTSPVDFDGIRLLGWWRVEPGTGALRSVIETDLMPGWALLGSEAASFDGGATTLAETALTVLDAFAAWTSSTGGLADVASDELCAAVCDLQSLGANACGSGSGSSLATCLDTRASAGVELLAGNRSCGDVLNNFACGSAGVRGVFGGNVAVRTNGDVFAGPWSTVAPYTDHGCSCP